MLMSNSNTSVIAAFTIILFYKIFLLNYSMNRQNNQQNTQILKKGFQQHRQDTILTFFPSI